MKTKIAILLGVMLLTTTACGGGDATPTPPPPPPTPIPTLVPCDVLYAQDQSSVWIQPLAPGVVRTREIPMTVESSGTIDVWLALPEGNQYIVQDVKSPWVGMVPVYGDATWEIHVSGTMSVFLRADCASKTVTTEQIVKVTVASSPLAITAQTYPTATGLDVVGSMTNLHPPASVDIGGIRTVQTGADNMFRASLSPDEVGTKNSLTISAVDALGVEGATEVPVKRPPDRWEVYGAGSSLKAIIWQPYTTSWGDWIGTLLRGEVWRGYKADKVVKTLNPGADLIDGLLLVGAVAVPFGTIYLGWRLRFRLARKRVKDANALALVKHQGTIDDAAASAEQERLRKAMREYQVARAKLEEILQQMSKRQSTGALNSGDNPTAVTPQSEVESFRSLMALAAGDDAELQAAVAAFNDATVGLQDSSLFAHALKQFEGTTTGARIAQLAEMVNQMPNTMEVSNG